MANKAALVWRFEVEGFKELAKLLDELPKSMSKKVLRDAAVYAMKIIEDTANAASIQAVGISDKTNRNHFQNSFITTTSLTSSQKKKQARADKGAVMVYVGSNAYRLAHLIEFGTGPRITKDGVSRGMMPPRPVLRPTWEQHKDKVLHDFTVMVSVHLIKASKRLARKAIKGKLSPKEVAAVMRS